MGHLQTQIYELFGNLNLFFLQEERISQTRKSTYKPFENSYHHGNVDCNKTLLPVLLVTSQKVGKEFFILNVGSHDKQSFTGFSRFSKFSLWQHFLRPVNSYLHCMHIRPHCNCKRRQEWVWIQIFILVIFTPQTNPICSLWNNYDNNYNNNFFEGGQPNAV